MHYSALASDYDGTLAIGGRVSQHTIAALEKVAATGCKLLLVTGRMLADLQHAFPLYTLFDYIVAENGALLYQPAQQRETTLGALPPSSFFEALQQHDIPYFTGKVIVATYQPYEQTINEIIQELAIEYQVILNKESAMILPNAINKATGLAAVLHELAIPPQNVIAFGDAENDIPLLTMCGYGVAVNNALPIVKAQADYVTKADQGDGVAEVITCLLDGAL